MLKYQITLIAVLIGCIAFVACDRAQQVLEPVMPDPEPEMMDTGDMTGMDGYLSWENRTLPGPWLDFKGDAHDLGSRTIYLNGDAAMANKAGTAYPAGSMLVKISMDTTNTFVSQISTMTKTDSADNSGWVYGVTGPPSATAVDMTMLNTLTSEMAAGACVGCHANATNDFVFVPLTMMGDGTTDGGTTDGGTTDDGTTNGGTTDDGTTNGGTTDGGTTDDGTTNGGTGNGAA